MIKEELKISLIQSELHWEDPIANRKMFQKKIESIQQDTDLIVLPEMFTTGFTMNAEPLAEEANHSETLAWMKQMAIQNESAIVGSVIIKENDSYFNRLYFVTPKGEVTLYDKKHTFTLAGEHKVYTAGQKRVLIDYLGWKICPLICYDLRFPVWARNTEDYDVLLYVANWPDKRVAAWDALLKARAIENLSYCIGVNRIGPDGSEHLYSGHSAVYDVLGAHISTKEFEKAFIETITLSKEHIEKNRKHLQFLADRDTFNLE